MSANMMYRLAAHSYFKQSAVEKIAQLYLALPSSAVQLQLSEPVQRNAVSESLTVWIFLFLVQGFSHKSAPIMEEEWGEKERSEK